MNIKPIIEPIQLFLTDPRLIEIIKPIQSHLDNVSPDEIDRFRTSLLQKLSQERNNTPFADAVFDTLIRLAKLSPINEDDYITLEKIPDERRVVTSEGHQYDIDALIKYHGDRDYRGSGLHEFYNNKWLLNPASNQPFSLRDVVYIKKVASERNIEIPYLRLPGVATSSTRTEPHNLQRMDGDDGLGRLVQQRVGVAVRATSPVASSEFRDLHVVGNVWFRIPAVSVPGDMNSFDVIINGVIQTQAGMWLPQTEIELIRQNIGNIDELKNMFTNGGVTAGRVLNLIREAEQAVQEQTSLGEGAPAAPSQPVAPTQMRDYPIVGNLSFRIPEISTPGEWHSCGVFVNGIRQNGMQLRQEHIELIRQNIGNINELKNIFINVIQGVSAREILNCIVDAEHATRPQGDAAAAPVAPIVQVDPPHHFAFTGLLASLQQYTQIFGARDPAQATRIWGNVARVAQEGSRVTPERARHAGQATNVAASRNERATPSENRDVHIIGNMSFRIPEISTPGDKNSFGVIVNGTRQTGMFLPQAKIELIRQNIENINELKNIFTNVIQGVSAREILNCIVDAERAAQEQTQRPRM